MASASLLLGVGYATAAPLNVQNFDAAGQAALAAVGAGKAGATAPAGWQELVSNDVVTNDLTVSNGNNSQSSITTSASTGAVTGFYATGDARDYSLGLYNSVLREKNLIMFTYTAASIVTDIHGSFDVESPWSYNDASTPRTGGFNNGFLYAVNNTTFPPTVNGSAWGPFL